ncbi:NOB1 family endonuclease [Methanothermobacter tenebrarum]|uniref:Endoribonuclease Nob1 n=1 Tax=Methanothermobacter tenebrarum TaxID=680118 RepID=A0A328PEV2_9EURY|nr:ribonuclease VapC [Methanothermobacter tenebrarum]MBC7100553.1 ribonuclease VapC [Methanobacteriales archaeon]MBC7118367.1 ribonuclease VapC [Methanobacteriaceae archaeon]NPV64194.1 ribonuclease VapC [Methanobacteriaceae archaeon]RAO79811.1 ribonuclease VapC [Methanothermobacter tenebrarum]
MKLKKYHKILDSSAFIGGYTPSDEKNYTTPEVTEELKDLKSRILLEKSLEEGKLKIINPKKEYIEKTEKLAEKSGDILRLSKTDKKIIALTLQLKNENKKVMMITDDYSIQNIMKIIKIPFKSVITEGINKIYQWEKICIGCKKRYPPDHPSIQCEICGSKIIKKKRK